ncbi:DUF485 domain-containing protein [Streptomyces sp. M2CJ-2]|uniref:DUF485 domain-containing protein n=1 Tax=Streptomyces sp. M2CJ-2 TaxID=2803948 RepID=UPI001926BA37|nr:DUF485 domain-containing protein [Streptomyces sp. M2CJ-2]MBL3667625.1 DUF485 domain-containing protein [Streptomyces sp. M2CJ-2]
MSYDPYPSPRDPSPWDPAPWDPPTPPHRNPYPPTPNRDAYVPSRPTYPWQPAPPAPPPPRRAAPRAPLGHHSDLRILRSAYRWQRRMATLTALGYFTVFLILSAYAPSFMTGTVTDGVPTGLLLAVLQVPVTWLAIAMYEGTARRRVDPLADLIRRQAALDAGREEAR